MNRASIIIHAAGVFLGGFLGWLYWAKVGCVGGACPIWSNMWIATAYGALFGFFAAGLIPVKRSAQNDESRSTAGPGRHP